MGRRSERECWETVVAAYAYLCSLDHLSPKAVAARIEVEDATREWKRAAAVQATVPAASAIAALREAGFSDKVIFKN